MNEGCKKIFESQKNVIDGILNQIKEIKEETELLHNWIYQLLEKIEELEK